MIELTGSRSDTRSKIVEVAARLLQEHGPAAVTTRGVAEAAGVQAPTIYRLFGDKDGLLEAVAEHVMATYVSAKAATVAAASAAAVDPVTDLRAGWDMQIDFGVANPTLFALLSNPERVVRSAAAESGRRVLASRVRRIAVTGRLRVSEQLAVDLIQSAGIGVIQTMLSTVPDRRDPGLAVAMFEAVLSHILADPPASAEDDQISTLVALRAGISQLEMLSSAEQLLLTEWLDRAINHR